MLQRTLLYGTNVKAKMGVIFLEHIGGTRLFSCASCDTNLTNRDQLISTRFTGATGRAFLFNKVVNLKYRYVFMHLNRITTFSFKKSKICKPSPQAVPLSFSAFNTFSKYMYIWRGNICLL